MKLARLVGLLLGLLCVAPSGIALADEPFVSGPYVDRLSGDSATVHVRTATRAAVTVRFETPEGPLERTSAPGLVHTIVVSGLPPDATIRYQVSASSARPSRGAFRTAPVPGSRAIEFIAIGDTRDGGARHAAVIAAVHGEPDFFVHLGDLVPSGRSVDEYIEFYAQAAPLLRRTAIVPVLGNHELILDPDGALFREAFAMPDPRGNAYYVFDFGGVRILVLDSNHSLDRGSPQHAFALRELERATADSSVHALFVAVHHGPMSSGRHGGLAAFEESGLTDAMRRARVDLVLSGHDHIYERGESSGLKYVVTGGGGSPLYRPNAMEPYQLAFVPAYHFTRIRVGEARIDIEVVRPSGSAIERCHFVRGGPFECEPRHPATHTTSPASGPVTGISPMTDIFERFVRPLALAIVLLALVAWAWRRMRGGPRA